MRLSTVLLAGCAAALVLPAGSAAQIRASEPATLTQAIDGTIFRIEYFRPRVRDRSPLFGPDAVVWEHTWTPGANWATKLAFQKDIEFEGVPVPAGVYSLWIDLDDETWLPKEFFLEPDTLIFHTAGPAAADDQIRFPVEMENDAPFKELLTWDFEDISSTGGVLALRWGTARIAFDVKVEPSMRITVTAEEAAPVEGEWEVRFQGPEGQESPPVSLRLFRTDDGVLHADWEGVVGQDGSPDEWFNSLDMWVLPSGAAGIFVPGEAYDGVFTETWAGYTMEFDPIDGRSMTFQVRDDLDNIFMRGSRVN